ncbi:MAG: metallophosphoesterase, partial [Leptolyngbyaceae bacterium]|nr:metallophosphoesterase [Leptolyngbyaceae bacterium]
MVRFLHVADVHLGFDRYDNKDRSQDFFYAFYDVLEKFAVGESVDFVLIAGDLFEHRMIQPAVLNQAQRCLALLGEANIPAIAIEGNHDNRPYGTKTNWLRYLAESGHLILLEPESTSEGGSFYQPWSDASRRGGYIDLDCGVRVLGSAWYGATAPVAIQKIAEAIADLPQSSIPPVLLFHHGLEGQIARYAGALRYTDLLPLKDAGIDYLALGHIHKNYSIDNWVFNPGSVEANSIEESTYERGVYLVDVTDEGINAQLKRDYRQRS